MQTVRHPKVAIIYRSVPHYRRRFYELLRERLNEAGIELLLIYGQPGKMDASKRDTVELSWAHKIDNRIFRFGSRELYWQPCIDLIKDADLVIVEQASKLLLNYYLFVMNALGVRKMAFWGHGKNFQGHTANRIGEQVKLILSRRVHWWFSYNRLSAEVVKELGFPEHRITDVQNAIDTRQLVEASEGLTEEDILLFKQKLGVHSENVALYAGGMYEEKRLPFLVEACVRIRSQVPDFHMIFLGAGAKDQVVKDAAARHEWIHYIGPTFDQEKVPYFRMAKCFLMPGLVGLAILDTFALGVPIVTTNVPYHSPEIDYLQNGVNGIMLDDPDDLEGYVRTVVRLLNDPQELALLRAGCHQTSLAYTIEEMAERFANGIALALK